MKKATNSNKGSKTANLSSRGLSGPFATRILCETVEKEERCRDKFDRNSMFMKIPRNPIMGDATERDSTDYAIPFHHSLMMKLEEQKYQYNEPASAPKLTRYVDERDTTFARPSPLVETVRQRINTIKQPHLQTLKDKRAAMEEEQYKFQQLIEYKKSLLEKTSGATLTALP